MAVDAAAVADIAAAIDLGIAVQHLAIRAAARHADAIVRRAARGVKFTTTTVKSASVVGRAG